MNLRRNKPTREVMMRSTDAEILQTIIASNYGTAAAIIAKVGTLSNLVYSDFTDLRARFHISQKAAWQLYAAQELVRRAKFPIGATAPANFGAEQAAAQFQSVIPHYRQERFLVMTLDSAGNIHEIATIYIGTVASLSIRNSEVLAPAVKSNMPSIIVAHTHPSGNLTPSADDVRATHNLNLAADIMNITLLDHLILAADGRFNSLKAHNLGFTTVHAGTTSEAVNTLHRARD